MLIGKGASVEIVEKWLEFAQLRGNERFIVGVANAWVGQHGERSRQGRLEPGRHQFWIQKRVRKCGGSAAGHAGDGPAEIGLREILSVAFVISRSLASTSSK